MIDQKKLHKLYTNKYNKRLFTHKDVERACGIDKNTFQRLRDSNFDNIKLKDAVKIFDFITNKKGN